jgi:hypothetical protein
MQRLVGYSFATIVGLYAAAFAGARASGQAPPGAGRDLYAANCSSAIKPVAKACPACFRRSREAV